VFASPTHISALENSTSWPDHRPGRDPGADRRPDRGGYITDVMSGTGCLINVVPGVIITVGVLALVDFDEPNLALLDRFDWWGLIFMAAFSARSNCAGRRPAI